MIRRAVAVAAVFGALTWLERRRPLREVTRPRARRLAINVGMTAVASLAVGPVQNRVTVAATRLVARRRCGLARVSSAPLRRVLGVVALDYTLWHWHRWCHQHPWLWRVHAAHHVDPDMDASTALRFHAGELLASVPFRAAQIVVLGVDRETLRAWETMLVIAILFHHSNVRLPAALDAALSNIVITPRLHGIHHAAVPDRLHTNFGTLLSLWDRLHRTRATDVEPDAMSLGLPVLRARPLHTLAASLRLPFRRELFAR